MTQSRNTIGTEIDILILLYFFVYFSKNSGDYVNINI